MRIFLSSFFVLLFVLGCASDEPKVHVEKYEDMYSTNEIQIYKQTIPIKKEVLKKVYKRVSPKIGLSNLTDFNGKSFNGEFVFNEDKVPFIEYRFDKPYIIKKIYLKGSGFIVDGNAKSSNIKKFEIVFFDSKQTPSYVAELDKEKRYINEFDDVHASGFILKTRSVYSPKDKNIDLDDVKAGFDSRIEVEVIDSDYIFDIVENVLSKRESKTSNEELLKTISLMNKELFKRLRSQRSDFNLPDESVVYLPADADMHYAVANTKDIFETGKYKTVDGRYKIYIFSDEVDFKEQEKIRVKKHKIRQGSSNRNLKTTEELPEHEDFIDFSEGS